MEDILDKEKGLQLGIKNNLHIEIMGFRDFPCGPVAKTLYSQCRGLGFNPWLRS